MTHHQLRRDAARTGQVRARLEIPDLDLAEPSDAHSPFTFHSDNKQLLDADNG